MKKKTKALQEEAEEFICREMRMDFNPDHMFSSIELSFVAHLMAKFYEYRVRFEK